MEKCLILVGMVTAVLLTIQVSDSKVCSYTGWQNNSNPAANGSEFEFLDSAQRVKLCNGSKVIDAQCADDKLEGFSGNKTDTALFYVATCTVEHGLICNPFKNSTKTTCPDMAIQYGCECINGTTSAQTQAAAGVTVAAATLSPSQSSNQNQSSTTDPTPNQSQNQKGDGHNNSNKGQHSGCAMMVLVLVAKFFG
ncbi:hypothetical protein ACF0H5_024482 [Mactra antiquata]